jgi:hypothetical protein
VREIKLASFAAVEGYSGDRISNEVTRAADAGSAGLGKSHSSIPFSSRRGWMQGMDGGMPKFDFVGPNAGHRVAPGALMLDQDLHANNPSRLLA